MKIILDIAPHEDGVHCGDCEWAPHYKNGRVSIAESVKMCPLFPGDKRCDTQGQLRPAECLAGEREYMKMQAAVELLEDYSFEGAREGV